MLGKKKNAKTNVAEQQAPVANASQAVEQANAQVAAPDQANVAQANAQPAANTVQPADNQAVAMPQETVSQMGERARVRRPLKGYKYTIINGVGKKEKGTFDAESAEDVRNFLVSQEYQVLEIKERGKGDIDIGMNSPIGANDLSFSLTQLSTYIKSGIPLADSVKILAKQSTKPKLKKSFSELVYQLLKGESLSEAMLMQDKIFPKLLINMVKTAEMTGDLPSILDDMAEYYTSMDQTRLWSFNIHAYILSSAIYFNV